MSSKTNRESGLRRFLSSPQIYNLLQRLLGGERHRHEFSQRYVRAKPGDHLLDIGCGTADILDHLDPAVRYFGYDMSSAYIGYATSKYQHRQATFECARVNLMSVKELPKMDVVVATGLIHHLDVDEVGALLEIARAALKPSGRFISIDPCYSAGQSRVAKWLIDKDRGEFVRDQLEYKQLGERVFPNIESVVLQRSWVPYTHHIMVCSA